MMPSDLFHHLTDTAPPHESTYLRQRSLGDAVDCEDDRIPKEPREGRADDLGEIFLTPPSLGFPDATGFHQALVKVLFDSMRERPKLLKLFSEVEDCR